MSADHFSMNWEQAVQWLRQQPDKAQLVLDCYFDDPLEDAAQRYWKSLEWQAVRAILNGHRGEALDVGAGRGIASYALFKEGFSVTALEPSPSSLVGAAAIRELASQTGSSIQICEEFSERIPFDDNSFDVVFARAVLHHTSDLKLACSEFLRVLKPGGIMLAIREHVISQKADLPLFLDIHPLNYLYGGENAFMLEEYKIAFLHAGFSNIQVISPWHSPLNFAPYDLVTLQEAIATKFGPFRNFVQAGFKLPWLWQGICELLAAIDRRPGRLYSFVGIKPR